MALTRSMLKEMGIGAEDAARIIEAHTETVESLKQQRQEASERAARADELEEELEALRSAQRSGADLEARYEQLKGEYEGFRAEVERERADAEKARLYRELLREQGVDERRIEPIVRVTDLSSLAVEDGGLAGREELAGKVAEEWGDFIARKRVVPARVDGPQAASGAAGGANPETVSRLRERHERLYGKVEEKEQP